MVISIISYFQSLHNLYTSNEGYTTIYPIRSNLLDKLNREKTYDHFTGIVTVLDRKDKVMLKCIDIAKGLSSHYFSRIAPSLTNKIICYIKVAELTVAAKLFRSFCMSRIKWSSHYSPP